MEKIDYLEHKINEILYELSYLKDNLNTGKILTNYLVNGDLSVNQQGALMYENLNDEDNFETINNWFLGGKGSYYVGGKLTLGNNSFFKQTLNLEAIQPLLGKTLNLSFDIAEKNSEGLFVGVKVFYDEDTFDFYSKEVVEEGENLLSFEVSNLATKIECFIVNNAESDISFLLLNAKLTIATDFKYNEKNKCLELKLQDGTLYSASMENFESANKANLDAANLSAENVENWKSKLGFAYSRYTTSNLSNCKAGYISVEKFGRICVLNVNDVVLTNYIGTYSGVEICVLPESYRPVEMNIANFSAEGNGNASLMYIHTNGSFSVGSWSTDIKVGKHLTFQIIYIAKE